MGVGAGQEPLEVELSGPSGAASARFSPPPPPGSWPGAAALLAPLRAVLERDNLGMPTG